MQYFGMIETKYEEIFNTKVICILMRKMKKSSKKLKEKKIKLQKIERKKYHRNSFFTILLLHLLDLTQIKAY